MSMGMFAMPRKAARSPTAFGRKLQDRLATLGISARDASTRGGFNLGYIGDIISGRVETPEGKNVTKLAEALEWSVTDLVADSDGNKDVPPAVAISAARAVRGGQVPLYAARIGAEQAFLQLAIVRTVAGLPSLAGVADALAVLVPNNLNAPRYCAGEIAFVSPIATIRPGDSVFVRLDDGTAGIFLLNAIGEGGDLDLGTIGGGGVGIYDSARVEMFGKVVGTLAE